MIQWLIDNKEWVFSGSGVAILGFFAGYFLNNIRNRPERTNLVNSNKIVAGRDFVINQYSIKPIDCDQIILDDFRKKQLEKVISLWEIIIEHEKVVFINISKAARHLHAGDIDEFNKAIEKCNSKVDELNMQAQKDLFWIGSENVKVMKDYANKILNFLKSNPTPQQIADFPKQLDRERPDVMKITIENLNKLDNANT